MNSGDYGSGVMGNSNNMMMPMGGGFENTNFSSGNGSFGGPMMHQGQMSHNFNNNNCSNCSGNFGGRGMGGSLSGSGAYDRVG